MDKRYILGILAILMLLPLAPAQVLTNPMADYASSPSYALGVTVPSGESRIIQLRTLNLDITLPTKGDVSLSTGQYSFAYGNAYIRVTSPIFIDPNTTKSFDPTTYFEINCSNTYSGKIYPNKVISIVNPIFSNIVTTYNEWAASFIIYQGSVGPQYTISSDEGPAILWSQSCKVYAYGEPLRFTFQIQQKRIPYESVLYKTPNDAISETFKNITNTFFSAVSLLNIFLVVAGFILFIFLLPFIWKTFEYIVHRVRRYKA
jgi:hypothetical protein